MQTGNNFDQSIHKCFRVSIKDRELKYSVGWIAVLASFPSLFHLSRFPTDPDGFNASPYQNSPPFPFSQPSASDIAAITILDRSHQVSTTKPMPSPRGLPKNPPPKKCACGGSGACQDISSARSPQAMEGGRPFHHWHRSGNLAIGA